MSQQPAKRTVAGATQANQNAKPVEKNEKQIVEPDEEKEHETEELKEKSDANQIGIAIYKIISHQ